MRQNFQMRKCLCGKEEMCSDDMIGPHFPGWGTITKHAMFRRDAYEHDICPSCMEKHEALFPPKVEKDWSAEIRAGGETGSKIGTDAEATSPLLTALRLLDNERKAGKPG
jgi:hypothetical protein